MISLTIDERDIHIAIKKRVRELGLKFKDNQAKVTLTAGRSNGTTATIDIDMDKLESEPVAVTAKEVEEVLTGEAIPETAPETTEKVVTKETPVGAGTATKTRSKLFDIKKD